jgi:hypothetical protein
MGVVGIGTATGVEVGVVGGGWFTGGLGLGASVTCGSSVMMVLTVVESGTSNIGSSSPLAVQRSEEGHLHPRVAENW